MTEICASALKSLAGEAPDEGAHGVAEDDVGQCHRRHPIKRIERRAGVAAGGQIEAQGLSGPGAFDQRMRGVFFPDAFAHVVEKLGRCPRCDEVTVTSKR